MQIVNEEQLRIGFAKMRSVLEPISKQNDEQGCAARCQLAAGEQLQRFLVSEVERGTPTIHIAEAMSMFAANAVAGFIRRCDFKTLNPVSARKMAAEQFCQALYADIVFRLDEANLGHAVFHADVEEGGRA